MALHSLVPPNPSDLSCSPAPCTTCSYSCFPLFQTFPLAVLYAWKPLFWQHISKQGGGLTRLTSQPPPPVPVSKGRDEVEAAVHTVVLDVLPVQATLVPEILFELLIYVVGDGLPAGEETGQGSGEQGCSCTENT